MDKLDLQKILSDPGRVLELEKTDPRQAEELWHGLAPEDRLRAVLAAKGPDRERLIVLSADSGPLLRSLAPDEFASTVLELGPDDAGALIELCSDEQLTYLLDLTGWAKEGFSPQRYQIWLPLVLDAGAHRLRRWLESTDLEVLALLFAFWMRVIKWLPSQDEQEPPDDLPPLTLDNVYYIEIRDTKAQGFIGQVLVLLKSEMPQRYGEVMETILWELPTPLNEFATRWRTGRMADHGFPDRLEALELWAQPAPGESDWQDLAPKAAAGAGVRPRSDGPLGLLPENETLPVVAGLMQGEALDALRSELAYIANCGVAALEADPASPDEVARAATESLGLVNLGLEILAGGDEARARSILSRLGLAALARQGAQAIRGLNQRAWLLVGEGWLKNMPTGLHALDEPLDRWLAGLIFPRPRCYDPTLGGGREYRSFLSQADLEAAKANLSQAEFWGELLFELMGLGPEQAAALWDDPFLPADPDEIKLSHLVGTWLARRALDMPGLEPIPFDRLDEAVAALREGLGGGLEREIDESLQALADPTRVQLARRALESVMHKLSAELGRLNPEQELDPRYISGLIVAP
jgi:uncharacterized protein DUF6178